MTALFLALLAVGATLCVAAYVWACRTRHARTLWRRTSHDTSRVAIVLELEDKVREIETARRTVDVR